jgi:catechol 2,3-dioxygenase-like lactoylglutathione lyase family enzyme
MRKVYFLFFAAILVSFVAFAQQGNEFKFRFNHVSLSVKDADKSVKFYSSVLQLSEITNRTKKEGIRWMSLGEDKELHLISTVPEPVTTNKAIHFALTSSNFDAFINKLKELKVQFSDWAGVVDKVNVRADGIRQIYLQDPDGYWIEVNSADVK